MLRRIIYFTISFLFMTEAGAQITSPVGKDASQPIEITSDSLEVLRAEGRAIFTGDVLARQGSINIRSTKMTVYYQSGKTQSADKGEKKQAKANDANKISKIVVDDNVFITTSKETASGNHGVYDIDTGIINLDGNVTLTSMKNIVKGDKLVYNLKTGQSKMVAGGQNSGTSGEKKRVHGVFVPSGK